jgi:hypothetical protein
MKVQGVIFFMREKHFIGEFSGFFMAILAFFYLKVVPRYGVNNSVNQ